MVVRHFQICKARGLRAYLTARPSTILTLLVSALLSISTTQAQERPALLPQKASQSISTELSALSPTSSLLDAWAIVERHASPQWAYGFVQEKTPDDTLEAQRLALDLESVALEARLSGKTTLSQGLAKWSKTVMTLQQSRIPGRFTSTWLMNHLRDVPQLEDLALLGWCAPPTGVEIWSALGVTHQPWQPDMTTDTLLRQLPKQAYASADHVHVITPLGEIQRIGIGAWNYQSSSLVPGSRIVTQLPLQSATTEWLNTAIPRFLSTRVPGINCVTFPLSLNATSDIHAN